ncbi:alpha/beta hydrolase [Halioxenophilus sp. WMMB6]|uniref:alpha/beta fold hydrolase n=1 Tax=Halioxenophilus sp. WMMB6 TaxID=3073815 RepID=UPI00295E3640|nr:alpha/beta hydrolase [Halioxenophilus sp. WMMB6]
MTWVWLRGLAREAGHWGGLPRLAEQATGERVVCIDLPGTGAKFEQESPLRMSKLVAALKQETSDLGDIKLLAVSLGGLVGLHWAAADPRIHQLFLINSSSKLNFFFQRLRLAPAWQLLSTLTSKRSVEEREREILAIVSNDPERARQVLSLWTEIARRRPVSARQVMRQLLLAATAGLPKPERLSHCQIQILASQADRLVACKCSQRLSDYFNCSLVVHPRAGHDLPLDAPDWLLRKIAAPSIKDAKSRAGLLGSGN